VSQPAAAQPTPVARLLQWCIRLLWWALASGIVLLAAYVSIGRYFIINLAQHQAFILGEINARLPVEVAAQGVRGEWEAFTPTLVLESASLRSPGAGGATPLQLDQLRLDLDVPASLRTRSVQLRALSLSGLRLRVALRDDGSLHVPGLSLAQGGSNLDLLAFIFNTRQIQLAESHAQLVLPDGVLQTFSVQLRLQRGGSFRRLDATLTSLDTGDRITVLAESWGDPLRPDTLQADAHISLDLDDLGRYAALWPQAELYASAGRVTGDVHLGWRERTTVVDATVEAENLAWGGTGSAALDLLSVGGAVHLILQADAWQLHLTALEVMQEAGAAQLEHLAMTRGPTGLEVSVLNAPLAPIAQILSKLPWTPAGVAGLLRDLGPVGHLPAARLSLPVELSPEGWTLTANFVDLGVASWNNAPGVSGADGYIEMRPGHGRVFLESESLLLSLPRVFTTDLAYDYVAGVLDLDWDDDGFVLRSGLLKTRGEEGYASGLLRLQIPSPDAGGSPAMDLQIGLSAFTHEHRSKYLPFALPPRLLAWIDTAFDQASIRAGGFIWRGSLAPGDFKQRTVQLFFDADQADLRYHPDWPMLQAARGVATVDDGNISIWLSGGQLYGARLRQASAEVRADPSGQYLEVAADLDLAGSDVRRLLRESPLRNQIPEVLASWDLDGEASATVRLGMDLARVPQSVVVEVFSEWRDAVLHLPEPGLTVSDISGRFGFSTAAGFSSHQLTGQLAGHVLSATIDSPPSTTGEGNAVRVAVSGRVDLPRLLADSDLDLASVIEGSTRVDAVIDTLEGVPLLRLRSDLQGLAATLPAPWGKSAATSTEFSLLFPLGTSARSVRPLKLVLGDHTFFDADLSGPMPAVALNFGSPPLGTRVPGLHISGGLQTADGVAWIGLATAVARALGATDQAAFPVDIDALVIDHLDAGDIRLGGSVLDLVRDAAGWRGRLRGGWFDADVALPPDLGDVRIAVRDLDLAELLLSHQASAAEAGDRSNAGAEPADDVDQERPDAEGPVWPPVVVSIERVRSGQEDWGALDFRYQRKGLHHRVDTAAGQLRGLRIADGEPAVLEWQGQALQGLMTSRLRVDFDFDNLGAVLARFGYAPIIESRSGQLGLDLQWQGSPARFVLARSNGEIRLQVSEGSFRSASAAASGALRVVGILNLAEMVVRLDPSRPFQSGIPFDTLDADMRLWDGELDVRTLDVRGPGSRFQVAGVADLQARTQTGELVATLPVTNNLPWVAALAGGLPAAAGLFIVSRVFEKQIKQVASLRYRIGGTWDDPEVQLDRLFASPSAPAVSQRSDMAVERHGVVDEKAEQTKRPDPPESGPR